MDESLLEILRCPACDDHPRVELKDDKLVCRACGSSYPIVNGIPVMLPDETDRKEVMSDE